MATRAQPIDFLAAGVNDPSDGQAASGWYVSFHTNGGDPGGAGSPLTNTKNAYSDEALTAPVTSVQLDTRGAADVFGLGDYRICLWDADPTTTGTLKDTLDDRKYDFGVGQTVTITEDYAVTLSDAVVLVDTDTAGAAVTVTLLAAATGQNFPVTIKQIGDGTYNVVVAAQSGETIDGASTDTFSAQNQAKGYTSTGSAWFGGATTSNASTLNGYSTSTSQAASSIIVTDSGGQFPTGVVDIDHYDGAGLTVASNLIKTDPATQANQETATEANKPVVPAVQQFHPSACKSWVKFTPATVLSDSYNVASVADDGVGLFTVTISTDHSTADYCINGTAHVTGGGGVASLKVTAQAAGTFQVAIDDKDANNTDPDFVHCATFGDQ